MLLRVLLTSGLLALAACRSTPLGLAADQAEVRYVYDGDTILVRVSGRAERVRLIGIDTPESVSRSTAVECHCPEAADTLRALLPVGTVVRLVRDVEPRDPYDRLLAYVFRVDDELFVNVEMARLGEATELFIGANIAYVDSVRSAVAEARQDVQASGVFR